MDVKIIPTQAFPDQKPGTSGLRKKVSVFNQSNYLENYIQCLFDSLDNHKYALVLGGDGRYYNDEALQTIIKMAVANEIQTLYIGQYGLLSTPAASTLIRLFEADAGIILSASHNPAGPDGDFGIKFNTANGAPASDSISKQIYDQSQKISHYRIVDIKDINLARLGHFQIENTLIRVIDPVADYAQLMSQQFDFPRIQALFSSGFTFCFDAMHAITGPYAIRIFEEILGATPGSVINSEPLPDFGGGHPDPNLTHAKHLVEQMFSPHGPQFGAASDGDGDRNLILGNQCFVNPSDSLAVLTAYAKHIPAFESGITGVARSMPTSKAVDKVADFLGIECHETPTGWKYFCNLMDSNRVQLCGEESFGTGSNHIREKDGLWAVLFWLNIIAVNKQNINIIMEEHWRKFGRHYYTRHDYENLENSLANDVISDLLDQFNSISGKVVADIAIKDCNEFSYVDPVDKSESQHQGIRIIVQDGRIIFRLSGTGTEDATLRIYYEQFEPYNINNDPQETLKPLFALAEELTGISSKCNKERPDVIT